MSTNASHNICDFICDLAEIIVFSLEICIFMLSLSVTNEIQIKYIEASCSNRIRSEYVLVMNGGI